MKLKNRGYSPLLENAKRIEAGCYLNYRPKISWLSLRTKLFITFSLMTNFNFRELCLFWKKVPKKMHYVEYSSERLI